MVINNVSPKTLLETKYLHLKETGGWAYAHRPSNSSDPKKSDVVMIAPVITDSKGRKFFRFIEQQRIPVIAEHGIERTIEFPAGITGDMPAEDSAKKIARNELKAELELDAKSRFKLTQLCKAVPSSPGCVSEISDLFLTELKSNIPLTAHSKERDPAIEKIYAEHFVPIDKVFSFIKKKAQEGKHITTQTTSTLLFALKQLGKLN